MWKLPQKEHGVQDPRLDIQSAEKTGSFNGVLIYVSLTALCAIISYGPIVGEIKRLELIPGMPAEKAV
jgi:hypothetical protein